jgi:hypothetical protein
MPFLQLCLAAHGNRIDRFERTFAWWGVSTTWLLDTVYSAADVFEGCEEACTWCGRLVTLRAWTDHILG